MEGLKHLADRLAIDELNTAFADHLDHDDVEPSAALFTEDALRNSLPPVDDTIPILIADFEDVHARQGDGAWRIRRRRIEPIFRNPAGVPPGAARGVSRPGGG